MMKRVLLPAIAAISIGLAVLAAWLVTAGDTEAGGIYHARGSGANASFYSEEGTVVTFVGVYAADYADQSPPGQPHTSSEAAVCISQYDWSTEEVLVETCGWASLPGPAFQIDKKLNRASLHATINVCPWFPATPTPPATPASVVGRPSQITRTPVPPPCFDVSVDLHWLGVGPLSRQNQHSHYHSPEFKDNWHCIGTWRDATATGSVSDGVTNFTPDPAFWAEMSSGKCGEVTVG